MRLLPYLLIAFCLAASCHKDTDDVTVPPNDTTHHDTTHLSIYPYSATYNGTMRVVSWYDAFNMQTWKDTAFDSSYNQSVMVSYPDSVSLVVHFGYWAHYIPYQEVHYIAEDSIRFIKRTDSAYQNRGYKNISYTFRGDSLIIRQKYEDGSQVYGRNVWFDGIKSR
jgi:hypothetical protein